MAYIEYISTALHDLLHASVDMLLYLRPIIDFTGRSIGAMMRSMSRACRAAVDERLQG